MTALAKLEVIADKLRNLSRIMAGGDGTARIDTPAWKRAAELADELETIRAALSPAELGGVEDQVQSIMHEVFKYADIAAPLRGPPMTQDESLPVRRAALAQDRVIRDKLYALSTPRAAEAVSEAELAEVIQRHTGCADSDGELSQKPGPTGHIPWSKEVG